jgi:hypothetical protein
VDEGLDRHPADPFAHAYAITLLARKGEPIDGAVRGARAAMPRTANARTELAGVLMAFVQGDSESVGVPVAAAALDLVNDALTLDPNDCSSRDPCASRAQLSVGAGARDRATAHRPETGRLAGLRGI